MAQERVAVVTGANKGIGYSIVKELSKKFDGLIYLTARNEELGLKALKELTLNGENIKFHQLDIDNGESIAKFANFIKEKHHGLDILINNAGILYQRELQLMLENKRETSYPLKPEIKNEIQATIKVNLFGTLNLCHALFPLLRPHARVVNLASVTGLLTYVKNESLRKRLADENATLQDISNIMNEYLQAINQNDFESLGYPDASYAFSKLGLISMTKIQQRMLSNDSRTDLVINSVCPGYTITDMTLNTGLVTPDQAAQTPIYLALLPENYNGPKGEFWSNQKTINWQDLNYKKEDDFN